MRKFFCSIFASGSAYLDEHEAELETGLLAGNSVDLSSIKEMILHLYAEVKQELGERFKEYIQPAHHLGSALGHDLCRFAERRLLLIFFDTYEKIDVSDQLLRFVMSAAGERVGWILAGQKDLWNNQKQRGGGSAFAAGYKALLPAGRALAVKLGAGTAGAFSPQEIQDYFSRLHQQNPSVPSVKPLEIEQIWSATQGIPLAVKLTADLYKQNLEIKSLIHGNESTEFVEQVAWHYFRHASGNSSERIKLYKLALMRRSFDAAMIARIFAESSSAESEEQTELARFYRSYPFVSTERGQPFLHQQIRHFMRKWLLQHRFDKETKQALGALKKLHLEDLQKLEAPKVYRNMCDRMEDDQWVEVYLDLTEILFWLDPCEGALYGLLFFLAAAGYRRSAHQSMVEIGDFFLANIPRPQLLWWQSAAQCLAESDKLERSDQRAQQIRELATLLEQGRWKCSSPCTQYTEELEAIAWWRMGEAYQNVERTTALYWYKRALARLPWHAELKEELLYLYWAEAHQLEQQRAYDQSIAMWNEALAVRYDFVEAYYSLGNLHYDQGNYQQAKVFYQYALELDPAYTEAYMNLGNVHAEIKDYQRAIEEYNAGLRLVPHNATLHYNRARAYMDLRDYKNALKDLESAIRLKGNFAEAYLNLGHVCALLNQPEQALLHYQQARKLKPDDANIAWTHLWANLGPDLPGEELTQELEVLIDLDRQSYVAEICASIILGLRQKNLREAATRLAETADREPDEWDPHFWQGIVLAFLGRNTAAQNAIEAALKLDLPPLFLRPLYWLKQDRAPFFEQYACSVLKKFHLEV